MSQFYFYICFSEFFLAQSQYNSHILVNLWRVTPVHIGELVTKTRFGMKPELKSKTASFRKMRKSFLAEEHGGVTVEFVLWLPVFAALIAGAVDISLAFMNQSNYWNVARDTARLVSRHALTSAQAVTYAESNATFGSGTPTAVVTLSPTANGATPTQVLVTISAPASSVDAFGIFGIFSGTTITASVKHNIEPR